MKKLLIAIALICAALGIMACDSDCGDSDDYSECSSCCFPRAPDWDYWNETCDCD